MALTAQETVLKDGMRRFGETFFTEDHLSYKLVGLKRKGERIWTIGNTWAQAIDSLERKVQRG